jgi:hypothetical protein
MFVIEFSGMRASIRTGIRESRRGTQRDARKKNFCFARLSDAQTKSPAVLRGFVILFLRGLSSPWS